MKEMELHFGMICNKEAIYSGLIECQSSNRQFAICYNSKNQLLVKICTVAAIRSRKGGMITVILNARTADGAFEAITVPLNDIESIYPINDFVK